MNNKKQIIFRADGNAKTGLGHLFRLFAVVEMLKADYDYVYYTKTDSISSVFPKDCNLKLLPADLSIEDEALWFSKHFKPEETILIADGYQFNSVYQKSIKEQGFKLVYIDDLASEYMYADVVINHSPHVKKADFKAEPYVKFALGTDYAMLRPSFLEAAKQDRVINEIDTAFVCFGGADPFDLSLKAVKALLDISNFNTIHVVLGGAYNHKEVFELQIKFPNRIYLHQNLSEKELLTIMQQSNFAIAPASTILYELCCVKMSILSGYFVDNQELIYKGFSECSAIFKGEDLKSYQVSDFLFKTEEVLKEINSNQLQVQKELFDSKIASRHLNLINKLC